MEYNSNDFPVWWRVYVRNATRRSRPVTTRTGSINYIKDEGDDGQALFKSINLNIVNKLSREHNNRNFPRHAVTLLDLTESADDEGLHQLDFVTPMA